MVEVSEARHSSDDEKHEAAETDTTTVETPSVVVKPGESRQLVQ